MVGTFVCFCIERRLGLDLPTGLQQALHHYARRLDSATKPAALPRFLRNRPSYDRATELNLALEPEIESMLIRESRQQAVSIEQLLTHAVFVYMADLDASGGFRVSA